MLDIQINEDYKITSSEDGKNIMIEKQIYKKDEFDIEEPTGKWKVDGYFGRNLSEALKGVIKRTISESDARDLDELIYVMESIEKRIEKIVSNLNL